jgi:DHA1 family tetracycline resistance protein-like MFS transporter
VAFGLTLVNLLIVLWRFPETLVKKREVRIKWWKGFSDVYQVFTMKKIRVIFFVIFLLSFGFNFFVQFFPVFLFERFSFNPTQIGQLFAYIGLWLAFSQGVLIRPISKKVRPERIVFYSIFAMALVLPLLLLPKTSVGIFLLAPLVGMLQGLLQPSYIAVVSNMTDKVVQGRVLGLNQSVLFFAQIFPPIIAGIVVSIKLGMPIIVASATTFLAWIIFALFFERNNKKSYAK